MIAATLRRRVRRELNSSADLILLAKACAWACVLPVAKHLIPLSQLALTMRTSSRSGARDSAREERIVTFARWAARLTRWRSGGNCLERGLIAYRLLCEAGANPELVVGVGRRDQSVIGHAWVEIDGRPAGESARALSAFTPVFAFSATGAVVDRLPAQRVEHRRTLKLACYHRVGDRTALDQ